MTLTTFLTDLIKHPNPRRADPERAAKKYGIRLDWAREYIQREIERRGC